MAVKIVIAVISLIPIPAMVIGIKPATFAIGKRNKNAIYGICKPKAITKM